MGNSTNLSSQPQNAVSPGATQAGIAAGIDNTHPVIKPQMQTATSSTVKTALPGFTKEVGYVVSIQDYLVFVEGLPSARVNDIIVTNAGGRALVAALEQNIVEAWMLDTERPKPGDLLTLQATGLTLPLRANLLGRTINPLGVPIDGGPGFPPVGEVLDLDVVAPGVDARELVTEQFYTGVTMIDTLIPIGRGQRELLFGEARAGKAQYILDVFAHQKNTGIVCVYAAIGKSDIDVKRFAQMVKEAGAADYTVIVAATSSQSAPMITITPSVAAFIAEHYRNAGKHVLLVLDDLATHAKYMREISLLAGRVPGRESYPADIFNQHSKIVERAGNFSKQFGGASITLLPVVETDIENLTNLIPTNVMSMTDGHTLFSAGLRAQGIYPAVDPDRSVTRVGRQTQIFLHKVLSDRIRSLLADYHEYERFGRFGSELTAETQRIIKRGKVIEELVRQEPLTYIEPHVQILILALVFTGFFDPDERDVAFVRMNKDKILQTVGDNPEFQRLGATVNSVELDNLIVSLKSKTVILETVCQTASSATAVKSEDKKT